MQPIPETSSLCGAPAWPVTGDETNIRFAENLTGMQIEVDIGGQQATVQYAGRGYYPGLDIINVQVPPGVSGCHVSVVVRSGDIVSNIATIPVAANGRTCSEPVALLTASNIQTLLSQPVINRGVIDYITGVPSSADATFSCFTNAQFAEKQPMTVVSFNDCAVYNFTNLNMATPNPIKPNSARRRPVHQPYDYSDTGVGNASLPFQDGSYSASVPSPNSLKGTYTFTGSGGPDVLGFSASVSLPGGGKSYTSSILNNVTSVTRAQGLTVIWTPPGNSDPDLLFIQISGYSCTPNAPYGAEFVCNVPLGAGRFTIPPAVLLALPPQPSGPMPPGGTRNRPHHHEAVYGARRRCEFSTGCSRALSSSTTSRGPLKSRRKSHARLVGQTGK